MKKDLLGLQKQRISSLKNQLKQKDRDLLKKYEELLLDQVRKSEKSYVVIRDLNKIFAATPIFMEKFHFDEKIIGTNCYHVLKNPHELNDYKFERAFRTVGDLEMNVVIMDGEKKDRFVYLGKEAPFKLGDDFYTRVHVYEIGKVKRITGKIKRVLGFNGEVKSIYDFIAREKVKEIKQKGDAEREDILKKSDFE